MRLGEASGCNNADSIVTNQALVLNVSPKSSRDKIPNDALSSTAKPGYKDTLWGL